jgi:copper chaperone
MQHIDLRIEGMHCDGCVKSVSRVLSGLAGVHSVEVSLADARASVAYDATRLDVARLKQAVERAGFQAP